MSTVRKTSVFTAVVELPGASYIQREQRLDDIVSKLHSPIIAGVGHYDEVSSIFVRIRVADDATAMERFRAAISGPFSVSTGVGVNRRTVDAQSASQEG